MRVPSRFSTFDREGVVLQFLGYVCFCVFAPSLGVALPDIMLEFSLKLKPGRYTLRRFGPPPFSQLPQDTWPIALDRRDPG